MRVLVLAFDPLTESMAGPAIRAWQLAQVLAAHHDVTLVGTAGATRRHGRLRVRSVAGDAELAGLVAEADAVFAPTSVVARHGGALPPEVPLAIDMYIPTHLENLERGGRSDEEYERAVAHQVAVINRDLGRGDFFLCASERQRDFWLGSLSHAGRVNPATFTRDGALRGLIDVVPFGIAAEAPRADPGALRRHFPGIGPGDPVVVWGGGVYDWFDPLSLVRAVDRLRRTVPDLRLVFLGMANPNPGIPEMARAVELRALSAELGLTGRTVFFNDRWVPYDVWGAYLLDADVAVSTHLDTLETRYSFRTRVLDYLWARRPMVLTAGDALSEVVAAHGLGVAVAPGDTEGIVAGLTELLSHPPGPEDFEPVLAGLRWAEVARPLVRWLEDPRPAPDRAAAAAPAGP